VEPNKDLITMVQQGGEFIHEIPHRRATHVGVACIAYGVVSEQWWAPARQCKEVPTWMRFFIESDLLSPKERDPSWFHTPETDPANLVADMPIGVRFDCNDLVFRSLAEYRGYGLLEELHRAVKAECAQALDYVIKNDVSFLLPEAPGKTTQTQVNGGQEVRRGRRKGGNKATPARKETGPNPKEQECIDFALECVRDFPEEARSSRGGKITASSLARLVDARSRSNKKWVETGDPPYCHERLCRTLSKYVMPIIRKGESQRAVRTKNVQRPD